MRVVVVGASSGLGRCLALGLGKNAEKIALLARRRDLLEGAAEEIGPAAVAITCDVHDEESIRQAIAEAVEALGGIDALVYTPAVGPLSRLRDLDADTWQATFRTNVTGAALVAKHAVAHLEESGGTAVFLSSVSASMSDPWPGLGAYAASKAALEKMVEAWRMEHPTVGFTTVVVGDCAGGEGDHCMTEFANSWDPELAGRAVTIWMDRAYMAGTLMDVQDLVDTVDSVLRSRASIPLVTVAPRRLPIDL
jgi:NAD(P)-dependent dehydrogenase (short-subunit alcohol dehydrogenase family)